MTTSREAWSICKNCKHWDRDAPTERRFDTLVDVDTCEYKEEPQRICRLVTFVSSKYVPEEGKPFMTDAEGRGASLWTPEDWSCRGFEGR